MAQIWLTALDPWNLPTTASGIQQGQEYLNLFTQNSDGTWNSDSSLAGVLSDVGVFKIYHQFAEYAPPEVLKNLAHWATAHNIKIALETPVLQTTEATAPLGFIQSADFAAMLSRLAQNGVDLSYVTMDEPLWYGHVLSNHFSLQELAIQVAAARLEIKSYFPNAAVGEVEPIPVMSAGQILQWLSVYEGTTGQKPDTFDFDVNWSYNGYLPTIQAVVPQLRLQGISYGMIFDGTADDTSNTAWVNDAILHAQQIDADPALQPDRVIFQTWNAYPTLVESPSTQGSLSSLVAAYLHSPHAPVIGNLGGPTTVAEHFIAGRGGMSGSTITIQDDGVAVGSGRVRADGSWSIKVSLHAGGNNITAYEVSVAGVASPVSESTRYDLLSSAQTMGPAAVASPPTVPATAATATNTVSFNFNLTQADITHTLAGTLSITGPDGIQQLIDPSISALVFADGVVDENSGAGDLLIDPLYVYAQSPSLWAAHGNPTQYFDTIGWKQGINPNGWFNTAYYLAQNPDVAGAGVNPLLHYEDYGWREGRDPSALFSTQAYLAANPSVATAGIDPLLDYLGGGLTRGQSVKLSHAAAAADPLVTASYYFAQLQASYDPNDPSSGAQASGSYHAYGWKEGLNPNAWFNTSWYLNTYPEVAASGMDPLLHYELYGWRKGYNPSPLFNTTGYLKANPDIAAAGLNPLAHFIESGLSEGRAPVPTDGTRDQGVSALTYVADAILPQDVEITRRAGLPAEMAGKVSGHGALKGSIITLYEGNTRVGQTIADGNDQWSADTTLTGNDTHKVTVTIASSLPDLVLSNAAFTYLQNSSLHKPSSAPATSFSSNSGSSTVAIDTSDGNGALLDSVQNAITHGSFVATQGHSIAVGSNSTVIGFGGDVYGNETQAVFIRDEAGRLLTYSFDANGNFIDSQLITNVGSAITVDTELRVVGATADLSNDTRTIIVRGDFATLGSWTFDQSGSIVAWDSLKSQGNVAHLDGGSTIIGDGFDYYGDKSQTLFVRDQAGHVTIRSFDLTSGISWSSVVLQQNGAPLVFGASLTVVGAGEDFFGDGGRTVFLRDGGGQVTTWSFDNAGELLHTKTLSNGTPDSTIDQYTKVISAGSGILGPNSSTVFFKHDSGKLEAWNSSTKFDTVKNDRIELTIGADGTPTAEVVTTLAATLSGGDTADPLVDVNYVTSQVATGVAPTLDVSAWFHEVGWKLGINPNSYFDTGYYLAQNPDVKAAGVDPLAHFEQYGWKEGRDPSLVLSDSNYLSAHPTLQATGVNPLQDLLQSDQAGMGPSFLSVQTMAADPLVNASYYDLQLSASIIPNGTAAQKQATASFDSAGWQKGLNPNQLFDTQYYLSHNPDVAAAHVNPLLHYEAYGWKEGRDPSALFSTTRYLSANEDIKAAGVNPLLHYIEFGQNEGRAIFAV